MGLLERDDQVAAVVDRFRHLEEGGHIVLISGEAGAGKTALVQELLDRHLVAAQVMVGRCDDLFAPRPLGPLADVARGRPGPLSDALAGGDQSAVFDAVLAELAAPPHPTVVVLEDLQWADEATLDLVRFVARRLEGLPCLILATHRDDLPADHPIRRAIGALVGPHVTRVRIPPLSVDAVRRLVGDRPLDPVTLHATTAGNAFFLVETIDADPGVLPVTVRDVVLARAAPLTGSARDALDAAAVLGRHADTDLVQTVADCDAAAIDECLRAGLLIDDGGVQSFRHDLTRQIVEEAMTPLRRRQLNARALEALGEDGDVVQRAHHAIGADDHSAVAQLAAQAADACVALGAWRQAALLYGEALDHGETDDAERLRLLEARATIGLRVELAEEAVAAADELLARIQVEGDPEKVAQWEGFLSKAYRAVGRGPEATAMVVSSVARLEPLGESVALANALADLAGHELVSGHYEDCAVTSRRAIAMAERFGLEEMAVASLDSLGSALGSLGRTEEGSAALREALDRAKRADLPECVVRACGNLASIMMAGTPQPMVALEVLNDGIAVAEEHELRFRLNCLRPSRAEVLGMLTDWDAATAELSSVLNDPWAAPINRVIVGTILGRIRARRGDPQAMEILDETLPDVLSYDEAQLIAPAYLARAEARCLAGDPTSAAADVEACLAYLPNLDLAAIRQLALMALRSGVDWRPDDRGDEALRYLAAGDHRALHRYWAQAACRYEAADALADSDDPDDLRQALAELTDLGARPRAKQVARRLRELGVREVPRGPRATTRANAAGLTTRELEVASLLAEGLTNAEIAERLVVSQKTVDHHASAVLTKLGVSSRRQVARAAAERGLDLGHRPAEV